MEKSVVHLSRALVAFLVLLLSLSRTRGEESLNFISEMTHDEKLCQTPRFLYNSSLAKNCGSTDYPKEQLDMKLENLNTFSCLAVYDTSYKLCNYSSRLQNIENATAFNSRIGQIVKDARGSDKKAFCARVKGITPMYEKTKNLVAPLMTYMNDEEKCSSLCFLLGELDPLCAMLAWIREIDEGIEKTETKTDTNVPASSNERMPAETSQHEKLKVNAAPVVQPEVKPGREPNTDINIAPDANNETPIEHTNENDNEKKHGPSEGESHNQLLNPHRVEEGNPGNPDLPKSESIDTAAVVSATNPDKSIKTGNADQEPKINNEAANSPSNLLPSDVNKVSAPSSSEDTKTSTISQNTQEHNDVAHDYSRLENEQPYDPEDADQPIDTNDQSRNIPEPSERRENRRPYDSIRPEEESHFFTYFTVASLFCIAGYIGYHNKQKILAIVVEGRRSRNSRGRRRPSTASYRKLDCTLEEAVTSQCNANVTHVIY